MTNIYLIEINGTAIQAFADRNKAHQFVQCLLEEEVDGEARYTRVYRYTPGEVSIAEVFFEK